MCSNRSKGSSTVALLFSVVAVVLAVVALMVAYKGTGLPGKGLAAYDFTTPKEALRSEYEMEKNGDLRARMEMELDICGCKAEELQGVLDSLTFDRMFDYEGKTLLLYKYKRAGVEVYEARWLERESNGMYHTTTPFPTWAWEGEEGIRGEINKAIMDWESRNVDFPTPPVPEPKTP